MSELYKTDVSNFTKEDWREFIFKLYEYENVDISSNELSILRKKLDKVLFKFNKDDFDNCRYYHLSITSLHLGNDMDDDDEYYYNNSKKLNEIKVMKYRFKCKYSWSKISDELGLSERQCQRIKDRVLNEYIISKLESKNKIMFDWIQGF